jgi:hypothetical protein
LLGHLNNSGNRGIGMHRADIDLEHNRLILHWIDSLNVSDVERLQAEVTSLLPKLRPGFDCISDIPRVSGNPNESLAKA